MSYFLIEVCPISCSHRPDLVRDFSGSEIVRLERYNDNCDYDRVCPACRTWYYVSENVLIGRNIEYPDFYQRPLLQNFQVTNEVRTIQEVCTLYLFCALN